MAGLKIAHVVLTVGLSFFLQSAQLVRIVDSQQIFSNFLSEQIFQPKIEMRKSWLSLISGKKQDNTCVSASWDPLFYFLVFSLFLSDTPL